MRFPLLLLSFTALSTTAFSATPAVEIRPGVRSTIRFQGAVEINSDAQYRMRMAYQGDPAPYSLGQESYEILVPKNYKETEPHGLFIWISPGTKPALTPEWEKVLAEKKLIFIAALNAGNNRDTPTRIRLAVDANHHLRERYQVDADRVYVAGHSGGGRVASMVGVAYADMFTGAACFMGVNYFRPVQGADGTLYDRRYFPHAEMATIAQQENRYALITGDNDSNLDNTLSVYEQGFMKDSFKGVRLFQIPNQGHSSPDAKWLEKVIEFLDTGK